MAQTKVEDGIHVERLELANTEDPQKPTFTRTHADELSIWQSLRQNKLLALIAMAAAFSASLEGYQINLNGGLVSNKGFIRQMASPGTKIIKGKYVSAWGGIQSAGQTIGQIIALYVIWVVLVVSVLIECFATHWYHWLVAKLFAGMGVGMLQSTLPLYLAEISPTQLKGLFINAYTFWFVLGQLFASVALNRLHISAPYDFRTPIYSQWAMIGVSAIIFVFLPETPWYLVSKGKLDQAKKVLTKMHGRKQGYDSQEQVDLMMSTIASERAAAEQNSELGPWAVFQGKNLLRFIIAAWPKITQQLVGLTVFNTYATYFFQKAGNKDPFLVTLILSCVQLISMIMTAVSTDKLGRRPLTVYPYAITVLSLLSLGIVGCFDYSKPALSSLLIFFACLATFSTTGASAIGYAYAAEIPQQRLRARTTAFALAFSNMVAIMFSFTTPLMINGDAQWGVKTGFFFAGTGAVAVVICWFILPEVACRTPAEIDEMFEKKVNLRKFKQYSPSSY
ncbi:general substrate transporter [Aureobasidium pullulans]|uniref:General substrate transporter n=1 Tax=Aureobasidium pullulans TaxID=5580 RepID=A0AB38LL50_AURPU|nr:general substrate transporter [Aureobasidium pullulans]THZ36329.1 general substrate transporter [Aureobasidium pullulans]